MAGQEAVFLNLSKRSPDERSDIREMVLGHAAITAHWWSAGHEHPQHIVTALARVVEAGVPMLGPCHSFAEYAPEPNPETKKKDVVWFALNEERPLFAFGGLWTTFKAA